MGATIASVRPIFGREITSQTIVVTEYEPGHLISYRATVPLLGQTVGGGTRLSRWGEVALGRAEGLIGSTMTRLLRSGWRTELSNLKRLIEEDP